MTKNPVRKPRVCWQPPLTRAAGVSYGYHLLVQHVANAITPDPSCPIALSVNPPENFRPYPDKQNVLLTMWESRDFPAGDREKIRQADALIVPSTFCKTLFEKIADCPVHLLPLGVDTDVFTYKRRAKPAMTAEEPFTWFWCASPDPRKGWGMVSRAWSLAFAHDPSVRLYMKTSGPEKPRLETTGNVVVDTRNLSTPDLAALFHGAHGFLYPSVGEGFGLTCAEAMATGCPVVGTEWSGHADFFKNETGWPIAYQLHREAALQHRGSEAEDGKFELAAPGRGSMIEQMRTVMRDYHRAQKKAERAARLIHGRYTWAKFEAGLADVLQRIAAGAWPARP